MVESVDGFSIEKGFSLPARTPEDSIYLFIYYIIVHEVQNTHIQRKIGLKT